MGSTLFKVGNSRRLAGITPSALGLSLLQSTNKVTIASGTVTADTPVLDLSQTWNNVGVTFSGLKLNITDSNSAAASLFADFQVAGTSKFKIRKDGTVLVPGTSDYVWLNQNGTDLVRTGANATQIVTLGSGGISINAGYLRLANLSGGTLLQEDAANTLALRNGTSPQIFNIYNTYTNASNYEALTFQWSSNFAYIYPTKAGTGVARDLVLGADSTELVRFQTGSKIGFFGVTPVTRPSAYTVTNGATDRAYDASATTVGELANVLSTLLADLKNLGLIS